MTKQKARLTLGRRILYFTIGLVVASGLLVFSFQWNLLPFTITALGQDVTSYALAGILVIISIFAGTLIKSGLLGEVILD